MSNKQKRSYNRVYNENKQYSSVPNQVKDNLTNDFTEDINAVTNMDEVKVVDGIDTVADADAVTVVEDTIDKKIEFGVVYNCSKLNVRKQPSPHATPITVINKGEKVSIMEYDPNENEFCKVKTASGIEGYCMIEFINVDV